ncbi:hypothetical protein [Variovorax sp. W2I14]|uniref:hypothetical protein n=1 Tax=Variovorax sp. W2I14 TaxID=3042290 RepID=UPI003D1BADE0
MDSSEWQRVLSLCDELAALMNGHSPGVNPSGIAQVRSLCARMRGSSNYINDRLNKIEAAADRYFSARKWASHARGAEGVKYDIVQSGLSRIRAEAMNRMGQQA